MNTPQFDLGAMLSAPQTAVQQIPCDQLHPYHNHKFELYSGERLEDMIASIKENGVLSPIIVQPDGNSYEILIGHNRWNASKLAGLSTVPAIVKSGLTEEEAEMYVIESNVMQRGFENLRISEQAAAVALRHSEMFSQGKRNDIMRELTAFENPSAETDTATLNPVGSKSTDLPANLILFRPYVFDGITMFCGTNGRKLFMDFTVFLPFRLPLSTEFQDLLSKCPTCYCIFSPLYHTAFHAVLFSVSGLLSLLSFLVSPFWLLPSRSFEIVSAEAILDLKSR